MVLLPSPAPHFRTGLNGHIATHWIRLGRFEGEKPGCQVNQELFYVVLAGRKEGDCPPHQFEGHETYETLRSSRVNCFKTWVSSVLDPAGVAGLTQFCEICLKPNKVDADAGFCGSFFWGGGPTEQHVGHLLGDCGCWFA